MTATPETQAGAPADVGERARRIAARLEMACGRDESPGTAQQTLRDAADALQAMQAERDAAICNLDALQSDSRDDREMIIEANHALQAAEARALAAEAEADRRVAEEREACAVIAEDEMPATQDMGDTRICDALARAAIAIRARTATVSGEGMG